MGARKRSLKLTWRQVWPIWFVAAIPLALVAFGMWTLLPSARATVTALLPREDMTLRAGELQPGVPKLFAYPLESGNTIEFFVERDANDHITIAFASCRKCYRHGYYSHGGQIRCGRCSEPMVRLNAGQATPSDGDCTQVPIPFDRSGDRLKVRASAVRDTFARWYEPAVSQDDIYVGGKGK